MDDKLPMGLRFSLLHRAFRRRMDALLSEKELTGVQFGVLGALIRREKQGAEEISQRDLEEATHVGHPTMTEILKRLERKGFLLCEQSAVDRRRKSIRPTEKAYSLKQELAQLEEETFSWLCTGLTEGEVASLLSATDRMLQNAYGDCNCKKGSDCGCDQDLHQVHP